MVRIKWVLFLKLILLLLLQSGGVVEWVPCSHVAHIYRGPRTESQHPPGANPHQSSINHMRLAHVWMDEYAKYYFIRNPEIQKLDYGKPNASLLWKLILIF